MLPTGVFHVSGGQIIDPNGRAFIGEGINAGLNAAPASVTADFPKVNFVRLPVNSYQSPSYYQSFINQMTAKGIVVEVEDHTDSTGSDSGGSRGMIYTGRQLTDELNWYASMAAAYANNPLVWFGTDNEPSVTDSTGKTNIGALSDWQLQTYNAIRNTGNANPVLLEVVGGGASTNAGMKAADYAGMRNVIWDLHWYGWETGYNTDQATVSRGLQAATAAAQRITGADGKPPVMIAEYGVSTTGRSYDANRAQDLQAIKTSGLGGAAWAWGSPDPFNSTLNSNGSLTAYGQQVAGIIAADSSGPVQGSTQPPGGGTLTLNVSEDPWNGDAQFTVSVDGTVAGGVRTASALHSSGDAGVIRLTGNWADTAHQVEIRFINDAYGGSPSTDRNLYVNSIAFNGATAANTAATLFSNGADTFAVGGSTAAGTPPADVITLNLAEDAYNGNADFALLIDGKPVSTPQGVTASHAAGAWQSFAFSGSPGAGSHTIGVQFTNDAYGGSPSLDRNLYVNGIDVNGTHYGSGVTPLYSPGTVNFTVTTTH